MPKMLCKCGEVLSWSEIPCPIEWLVIKDTDFDWDDYPAKAEDLYRKMKSLMRCPRCDRLWVFWSGFKQDPTEYVPARPESGPKSLVSIESRH